MDSIFAISKVLEVDFYYNFVEVDDIGNTVLTIHKDPDLDPPKHYKKGKIYIKRPDWGTMNDIAAESALPAPYERKYKVEPCKHRDLKIKKLLVKIKDHEGNITDASDKFIDEMQPNLALFIADTIDDIMDKMYLGEQMTKEEVKDLSYRCHLYFKRLRQKSQGKRGVRVPPAPSIITIKQICEMFHCTPDVARTISPRDLEMMEIVAEQERLSNEGF